MGNASPFDATARKEVQDCVDQTVVEFNKAYLIALAANLTKKARLEAEGDKKAEYKPLLKADTRKQDKTQKEGWMTKLGAVRKNWKRRYFIVHPDYTMTYHESPENKEKPKGTVNFYGYWVHAWSEKPLTIEMYHSYRRKWYFTCDSEEDFNQWKEALGLCTRYAPSPITTDTLLRKTYQNAWLKIWALFWGWSSRFHADGTEAEMLADLMMRQVRWRVLWRIFSNLKGPTSVQNVARDQITSGVNAMIKGAAEACWKGTCEARDKISPTLESTIKEKGGPIFEAMAKFKAELKAKILDTMDPLMEKGKPILQKVCDLAYNPIAEAHIASLKAYKTGVDKVLKDEKGDFGKADQMYWWAYWWMSDARKPLYDLQNNAAWKAVVKPPASGTDENGDSKGDEGADQVNNIVWGISDPLTEQMKKAFYTLSLDKNPGLVAKKLLSDTKAMLADQLRNSLMGILAPNIFVPLRATVMPILAELDKAIPDPMKQFLSMEDLFEEIVMDVISAVVDRLLAETIEPVMEKVTTAFNDICGSMSGINDPIETATSEMSTISLTDDAKEASAGA